MEEEYKLNLDERLTILKNAGQIDEGIYESILQIISLFDCKYNIKLTEENGAMLITHLSIALQRIKNGACVDQIDESMIGELESNKYFRKSIEAIDEIEKTASVIIPENEKNFIVMHLCALFQNLNIEVN